MEVSVLSTDTKHSLETVRVLHETVLALRAALEGSRKELSELRDKYKTEQQNEVDEKRMDNKETLEGDTQDEGDEEDDVFESSPLQQVDEKAESEAESEDIDDIELVFTTGETDARAMNEAMVSIRDESCQTRHKGRLQSVIVETDISKCGVVDENDSLLASRRNTLPDPLPYRPIVHRDVLATGRVAPRARGSPGRIAPSRPLQARKQETGAQTDITALPSQWKSETYLAHKICYNLTTLPSKFTLPVPKMKHIHLAEKTREARRVLLSDINFTSMVPELSRSADHLHQDEDIVQGLCKNYPGAFEYMKRFDGSRDGRTPHGEHCCELGRHGSRSSWGSHYGSRYQASTTSITPFIYEGEPRRRHSWRPPSTPCCHARHVWSSVPSSPTRCQVTKAQKKRSKVTFHHCSTSIHPGQSLPDLRLDLDSGDSTDSLVDEAEEYLRHSIDSILIARGRRRGRRHSDPDQPLGFEPPKSSQPFLPKAPRDLKHDYLVKVITMEGRVVVGRVRYSGPVTGHPEPHVGVELCNDTGFTDGTFLGHRYFECELDHGVFVPFKKVVIAWTT